MKNEETVVLFPNLAARLKENGFQALQSKDFSEALAYFDQMRAHDMHDERTEFGAVVCLMETGEWKEARVRCKELLANQDTFDVNVLDMYMSILVQLNDYTGISQMAKQIHGYPMQEEQRKKLESLVSFAQKMQQQPSKDMNHEFKTIFAGTDVVAQLQALQTLKQQGTVYAFPFLKTFLSDTHKHPYVKTAVLHLLKEHEIEEAVTVSKYGLSERVVPSELLEVNEMAFTKAVLQELDNRLSQENPTLLEALSAYWLQLQTLVFPLSMQPNDPKLWAVALEMIGNDRFAMHEADTGHEEENAVFQQLLEEAQHMLLRIETEGFLPL
ncbi:tetratricopeptide repeat protein [Ectobacillus antri]|jgi:tetratricopeptide (TPR) repeat protein|uniref:Tetratricopeptide repeat protein n=1 Tax=Ectobacillus antri TaxID=2486280 RepID=A0ABT6H140_9BACI|nr:tetratricopeptide repeat protein [Ectobacillus antri]MDG4655348.1 tetratricopeptide repeat protein [Ectobacillus antri]MDG5753106.1 tetratricopeptide repeat protein [Ectobacillus antri]